MLKKIGMAVGVLIILFLVTPLFLSSSYKVERKMVINKPVEMVYGTVADFNTWGNWDYWTSLEPNASYTVSEISNEVGSLRSWKGNVLGEGSMKIDFLEPNASISSTLTMLTPDPMVANNTFQFNTTENGTEVVWTLSGHIDGYMNRYGSLFMDTMIGSAFEYGLNHLKNQMEQIPTPEIEVVTEDSETIETSNE